MHNKNFIYFKNYVFYTFKDNNMLFNYSCGGVLGDSNTALNLKTNLTIKTFPASEWRINSKHIGEKCLVEKLFQVSEPNTKVCGGQII